MTRQKYHTILSSRKNPIFTNNDRKRAGLPLLRKANKKKRFYSRCEARETVNAFIDWTNYAE